MNIVLEGTNVRCIAAFQKCLQRHFGSEIPSRLYTITDGGGDRRVAYISVQKGYIALFFLLELDELTVCRTAADQSFKNPVERMHAIANKGLQSAGMRENMSADMQKLIKNANSNNDLRILCERNPELKTALRKSIDGPTKLFQSVFRQYMER